MRILHKENYYSLINGYKDLFLDESTQENNKEEKFRKGSTLDEIYSLSIFDRNLRIIVLKRILKIEREFKSLVAYEFCFHNSNHGDYLLLSSFNNSNPDSKKYEKKMQQIQKLIDSIKESIEYYKDKKDNLRHYIDEYGSIPFWVLVNTMSFGKISTFYNFMKESQKDSIALNYNFSQKVLTRYMKVLSEVRNICAHDERFFNIRLGRDSEIADTKYHSKLKIPIVNTKYTQGKNDFFAILIILKRIMEKEEYKTLMSQINDELRALLSKIKSIKKENLMVKMGLPANWLDLVTI